MRRNQAAAAPKALGPTRSAHAATRSHEVRIIGGQWKRTKLAVADQPGLRPTSDRVRETLFNWLGQDLTGWHCIDVFAGTGALGFEAASRGANEVLMIEQSTPLVAQLKRVQARLEAGAIQVFRGDGLAALKRLEPASMDAVFLDPPFDANLFETSLQAASRAVAPDGFVYLEAPRLWTDAELQGIGLAVRRHLQAGAVHAHLLKLIQFA